jgi:uncharacterized protein
VTDQPPPGPDVGPSDPAGGELSPEEWRRREEWHRYEQWRRAQWEQYAQWQAWQQEQWRREWQARREAQAAAAARVEGSGPARPSHPHAAPTPYHLILRTWTYHWWRPLVGIVLLAAGMLLIVPILTIPVLLVGVAIEGGDAGLEGYFDTLTKALEFSELSPSALLWLNLSLGGLILWTWLLIRVLHNLRPRWLTSVMPKMRWRFLWACAGVSVVALVVTLLVSMLLPAAGDPSLDSAPNAITGQTLALLVIVVLTTPLQSAGEEYAFRGYLLQAVGALTKKAWLALTVTSLLFALAHGVQNFPLFFDRFMFGFIAGWLVMRTGGLEAAIALHVLNNLLAFGAGILFGDVGEMLNVSEISWWNVPITLTQSLVYVAMVLLVARKMNVQRLTRPPAEERSSPAPEAVS